MHKTVKNSDQQASIFLQQRLKNASDHDRMKIVDAIVEKGFEMMVRFCLCQLSQLTPAQTNRFGNWAVQRCLESDNHEERKKIMRCMRCVHEQSFLSTHT